MSIYIRVHPNRERERESAGERDRNANTQTHTSTHAQHICVAYLTAFQPKSHCASSDTGSFGNRPDRSRRCGGLQRTLDCTYVCEKDDVCMGGL